MTSPAAPGPRFATIGDNCIDRFLPLGHAAVGGNAANVAAQLALAGENCSYFGAVGHDGAGRWTQEALARAGVRLDHLHRLESPTAWTDLDVDARGERFIGFEEFGACAIYRPTAADLVALAEAGHVHVGWMPGAAAVLAGLRQRGPTLSQDLAVNPDHAGLDVGFSSAEDAPDQAPAMMARMLAQGCRVAVVTCGARGSLAGDGDDIVSTGIVATEVIDTTGAGDTFIAAFLMAWKRGRPLRACLEAGRDAAARTCTHIGGFPQTLRRIDPDDDRG